MTAPPVAKRSLGQCFLVERFYARQIVDALQIHAGDHVLEIGPGRGILTEELLATGAHVIAVEIDRRLIEPLATRFAERRNFSLLCGDFLETELAGIADTETLHVCGNLPYHLVAEVLFRLFEHVRRVRAGGHGPWIPRAVLMMQREVADRVTGTPGKKSWCKLSVFAQLEARVEAVAVVPAAAFRPQPKVDGTIVRLDFFRLPPVYPTEYELLARLVRYTFSRRRKMLKSSLASLSGVHPHWQRAALDFTRRPETLSPSEWVTLADSIARARIKT